jgi:hypothetical protein
MLLEIDDLNAPLPVSGIPLDETFICKLLQKGVHVTVVIGEHFGLDARRPILEPSTPIGDAPQPSEEQPPGHRELRQFVIEKETGLDGAKPGHRQFSHQSGMHWRAKRSITGLPASGRNSVASISRTWFAHEIARSNSCSSNGMGWRTCSRRANASMRW